MSSPLFLVLFLIIPAAVILNRFVPLAKIVTLDANLIMVNNVCLLAALALRFFLCVVRLRQAVPYGAEGRPEGGELELGRPLEAVRADLAGAGYQFDQSGSYAEKRNPAFLGTTILYGGLFLVLLIGTFENLRQYSNVVLLGVGQPMKLASSEGISLGKGVLSLASVMPQLQVKQQFPPSSQWPNGATEIALLSDNNAVLARKTIFWGGEPLKYGGLEYHMGRFLYDAVLTVGTPKGYIEFDGFIKLQPLWDQRQGAYTHAATFKGQRGDWTALYDPARKALNLEITKKDGNVQRGEIVFQKDQKKVIGDFIAELSTMGSWSEIHVLRPHHMYLLVAAGVVALLGLLMRLVFWPQRVWLEGASQGSRAWCAGREACRLIKNKA
jgi:hypothetical protein